MYQLRHKLIALSMLLAACLLCTESIYAQAPQGINYQAVARDAAGNALGDTTLSVTINLSADPSMATLDYSESWSITTNQFGLFTLTIGDGTPLSGTFNAIDWSGGEMHLNVEIGTLDMGTTQLVSVPYALYAENAGNTTVIDSSKLVGTDLVLYFGGDSNVTDLSSLVGTAATITQFDLIGDSLRIIEANDTFYANVNALTGTGTDDQQLSFSNDTLYLEDGSSVFLGGYLDNTDAQVLSFSNDTLYLSNGGNVFLGGLTGTDDQALSISNDTLYLEDGGSVYLGSYLDNTDAQVLSFSNDTLYLSNGGNVYIGGIAGTDDQALTVSNDTLYLEDGGSVYLGSYLDNTDAQVLSFSNDTLYLSNGGSVYIGGLSGTDDQALTVSNDTLYLEDGGSVYLGSYLDNTDAQVLSFSNDTLYLSNGGSVYIGGIAGTDDQALTVSNDTLYLEDGGSVYLGSYLDNTDAQVLSFSNDTLYLSNGGNVYIGGLAGTDDQALTISNDSLFLEDGGAVDLVSYLDNTDAQVLSFSNDTLYLSNGGSIYIGGIGSDDQALTISNDTVFLEDGGFVILPSDSVIDDDADATNELITSGVLFGDTLRIYEGGDSVDIDLGSLVTTGTLDDSTRIRYGLEQVYIDSNDSTIRIQLGGVDNYRFTGKAMEVVNLGGNIYIGENAGANDSLSGLASEANIGIGQGALQNTHGASGGVGGINLAIGYQAMQANTTGNENVALGSGAMNSNTTGNLNTAVGRSALASNTTGNSNTAVGRYALILNTTGFGNSAIGQSALTSMTTGFQNVAVGEGALSNNLTGDANVAVGNGSGEYNLGSGNVFLGAFAGYADTNASSRLYIENSTSSTPLIYGEFDNDVLQINGAFRISDNTDTLEFSDYAGTNGDVLTYQNGQAVWQSGTGDNLGDHTLDSNLRTNGFYLSNDGDNEGLFVTTTGRVGLGTNSPTRELQIHNSSSTFTYLQLSHNNSGSTVNDGFQIGSSGQQAFIRNYESGNLNFFTDAQNRMVISGAGRVGIGNTTPASLLDVSGEGRFDTVTVDGAYSLPTSAPTLTGQVIMYNGTALVWDTITGAGGSASDSLIDFSISNDTLSITDGNGQVEFVDLSAYVNQANNDNDSTNELQTVSISNDTIYLTDGGFAVLPPTSVNNDNDSTNELNASMNISNDSLIITDAGGALSVDLSAYINAANFDNDSTNELQALTLSNDTVYLSDGGFVVLPADQVDDADADSTNEIQSISISNDTVYLTGGGFAVLPPTSVNNDNDSTNELNASMNISNDSLIITDAGGALSVDLSAYINAANFDNDSTNELQALTLSNDTVYLSDGGFVVLPADQVDDADADSTNEIQTISISNDTVYLTGGGFAVLPNAINNDNDSTNELISSMVISNDSLIITDAGGAQGVDLSAYINDPDSDTSASNEVNTGLSITNDSLFLTDAGGTLSADLSVYAINNDNDSTNELQVISISNDTIYLTGGGFAVLPPSPANNDNDSTNELIDTAYYSGDTLYIVQANDTLTSFLGSASSANNGLDTVLQYGSNAANDSIYNLDNLSVGTDSTSSEYRQIILIDSTDGQNGGLSINNYRNSGANKYGLDVNFLNTTGTSNGAGIVTRYLGTTNNSTGTYRGIYNRINEGSGTRYGIFNEMSTNTANGSLIGTYTVMGYGSHLGTKTGSFMDILQNGSSDTAIAYRTRLISNDGSPAYAFKAEITQNAGTTYGLHIEGDSVNYISGKLGLGTTSFDSTLNVSGGAAIDRLNINGNYTLPTDAPTQTGQVIMYNGTSLVWDTITGAGGSANDSLIDFSISNDTIYLTDGDGQQLFAVLPTDQVDDADADSTNEIQTLSISNDTVYLTSGGFAVLPASAANFDNDSTNELNASLNISNDSLIITDAGGALSVDLSGYIAAANNDNDSTNELQALTLSNDTVYLSDGGFVVLPADQVDDADADSTNEIQSISISNDTVYLTGGGFAVLPASATNFDNDSTNELLTSAAITNDTLNIVDAGGTYAIDLTSYVNAANFDNDSTNELQALTLSNDTVYLSDGGFVVLPADQVDDADADSTNEIQSISISNDTVYLSGGGFAVLPASATNFDNDSTNELNASLNISNDSLIITDAGGALSVDLSAYAATADTSNLSARIDSVSLAVQSHDTLDNDTSATNELNTALSISNDSLIITDAGGNLSVDLSTYAAATDTSNLSSRIDSVSTAVQLDNDTSASNELNTALSISNDSLIISDAGGNLSVDLSTYAAATDTSNLSSRIDSVSTAVQLDNDTSASNELNTGLSISNDSLIISDAGGNLSIDLSAYVNGVDNDTVSTAVLVGDSLALVSGDGDTVFADLNNFASDAEVLAVVNFLDSRIDSASNAITMHVNDDNDTSATNEIQTLSISNDTVYLSNGGFAVLPPTSINNDNDSTNELNTGLSLSNDSLIISDAGGNLSVDLSTFNTDTANLSARIDSVSTAVQLDNDTSATNELNTGLSISNDSLIISDAGGNLSVDLSTYAASTDTSNLSARIDSVSTAVQLDNDTSATNEAIDSLTLTGPIVSVYEGGGLAATLDLSGLGALDIDTVSDAVMIGDSLVIVSGDNDSVYVDMNQFVNSSNQDLASVLGTGNQATADTAYLGGLNIGDNSALAHTALVNVNDNAEEISVEINNGTTSAALSKGIFSRITGTGTGTKYAIYGEATANNGDKYGVYGEATGNGNDKYGIYGTASGTGNNYAGYFDQGFVSVNDSLVYNPGVAPTVGMVLTAMDGNGRAEWQSPLAYTTPSLDSVLAVGGSANGDSITQLGYLSGNRTFMEFVSGDTMTTDTLFAKNLRSERGRFDTLTTDSLNVNGNAEIGLDLVVGASLAVANDVSATNYYATSLL